MDTASKLGVAVPQMTETLFKHYLTPKKDRDDASGKPTARSELMYDEIFNLVKRFLEVSCQHTTDAVQKMGQEKVSAPVYMAWHRLEVGQNVAELAAKYLIEAFGGEEMTYKIAGGTKWWQDDYDIQQSKETRTRHEKTTDDGFVEEMNRGRCMLFIHGGGYYSGSVNTHNFFIWRMAKAIKGRVFSVCYRKAPQYPFPCGLQDALAAYIYLIHPPPGAPHKPVDPGDIVIAGDSAGGGLTLALLQVLRDTPGLPLPSGACVMSPWCDLTHSFPSVFKNTKTDFLPPYSFIHKPSALWPAPPKELTREMQSTLRAGVKDVVHGGTSGTKDVVGGGASGVGDVVGGGTRGVKDVAEGDWRAVKGTATGHPSAIKDAVTGNWHGVKDVAGGGAAGAKDLWSGGKWGVKDLMSGGHSNSAPIRTSDPEGTAKLRSLVTGRDAHKQMPEFLINPMEKYNCLQPRGAQGTTTLAVGDDTFTVPLGKHQVMIDSQVQFYAANAQLCHPYVSPALGYFGGLPPIMVICGDSEVLRDEAIYLAHKAAHPTTFPVRDDIRAMMPNWEGIEERHPPTDVHLQIYDGVGHDIPLFCMTGPGKNAFKAAAAFCRRLTPGCQETEDYTAEDGTGNAESRTAHPSTAAGAGQSTTPRHSTSSTNSPTAVNSPHMRAFHKTEETVIEKDGAVVAMERLSIDKSVPEAGQFSSAGAHDHGVGAGRDHRHSPNKRAYPELMSFPDHMIRERVNFKGHVRPLEPMSELEALRLPLAEIGMFKKGIAFRFIEGQALWDHKFRRTFKKVNKRRMRNLQLSQEQEIPEFSKAWSESKAGRGRRQQANVAADIDSDASSNDTEWGCHDPPHPTDSIDDTWQWALDDEEPPAAAVVSRRDIPDGRTLAMQADRIEAPGDAELNTLTSTAVLTDLFHKRDKHVGGMKDIKSSRDSRRNSHRSSGEYDGARSAAAGPSTAGTSPAAPPAPVSSARPATGETNKDRASRPGGMSRLKGLFRHHSHRSEQGVA